MSWWPGDGNATDIVGGNDGTLVNGAGFAAGQVGQAFSFDGSNAGVVIADSASFDIADFTLDAWIKTTNAGSGRRRIISQQEPSPNQSWVMSLFNNQLEACSRTSNGVHDLGAECVAFTGQSLNDGQFHHVAITRKTGVEIKWYIDGVNVKTQAITNTGSFAIAADVFIGKLDPIVEAFFSTNESFNGFIDEVEIFNRALSASEIQAIFNAGSAGKCKSTVPLVCDIQLNRTTFVNGDQVIAQVARLANPGTNRVPVEVKLWFELPGNQPPFPFLTVGADGSFVLTPGFNQNFGPLPLATVQASIPRGQYSFNCRLLHAVTGAPLGEDFNPFQLQ